VFFRIFGGEGEENRKPLNFGLRKEPNAIMHKFKEQQWFSVL